MDTKKVLLRLTKIPKLVIITFLLKANVAFSQDTEQDTSQVIELNNLSKSFHRSYPDSSRILAFKALKLSNKLSFEAGAASSYDNLGLFHFYQGNYDSAYHYWQMSFKKWQSISNQSKQAKLLGSLAIVCQELNKPIEAIALVKQAIKLHTEMHDSLQVGNQYNNLGIMYKRLGDNQKALESHYKALEIRQTKGDTSKLPSSYVNLGSVYNVINNLDSSQYFLSKALDLFITNNDIWGISIANSKLGEMYFLLNNYDSALKHINRAIENAETISANHLLVEFFLWKAKILVSQNRLDEALKFINKSDEIALNQEVYKEISPTELLAEIYFKKKNYKLAASYFNTSLKAKDSVYKANTENKIADIIAKSYYDLKEAQLNYEQKLEQERLNYIIERQNYTRMLLIVVILFILLVMVVIIRGFVLIKRKNKILDHQRDEIDKLIEKQNEIIEMKTTELLSSRSLISKFAFMNSHELRGPLARMLGLIHLSDKNNIDEETFTKAIKASAKELEDVVNKISTELNKCRA